jgi:hypothetical protein
MKVRDQILPEVEVEFKSQRAGYVELMKKREGVAEVENFGEINVGKGGFGRGRSAWRGPERLLGRHDTAAFPPG